MSKVSKGRMRGQSRGARAASSRALRRTPPAEAAAIRRRFADDFA